MGSSLTCVAAIGPSDNTFYRVAPLCFAYWPARIYASSLEYESLRRSRRLGRSRGSERSYFGSDTRSDEGAGLSGNESFESPKVFHLVSTNGVERGVTEGDADGMETLGNGGNEESEDAPESDGKGPESEGVPSHEFV